jgi:hypothetical protein
VVATIQVTDKLRLPIATDGPSATMILADGSSIDGQFVSGEDLPRLETEFPALTPLLTKPDMTPIAIGETIAPGATRTGEVVLLFPKVTEEAWHAKKSATLTINISRQKPVSVPLP